MLKSRVDLEMYWQRGWDERWRKGALSRMWNQRRFLQKLSNHPKTTHILPQIQKMDAMTSSHISWQHELTIKMLWNGGASPFESNEGGEEDGWRSHGWFWVDCLTMRWVGRFVPENPAWPTMTSFFFFSCLNDLLKWGEADKGRPGELWLTTERREDEPSSIIHHSTGAQSGSTDLN